MIRDNAKCMGNGCNIRESCDRFVRPAVDRQTWIDPRWETADNANGEYLVCMDWWPLLKKPKPVEPHGGASEEEDQC